MCQRCNMEAGMVVLHARHAFCCCLVLSTCPLAMKFPPGRLSLTCLVGIQPRCGHSLLLGHCPASCHTAVHTTRAGCPVIGLFGPQHALTIDLAASNLLELLRNAAERRPCKALQKGPSPRRGAANRHRCKGAWSPSASAKCRARTPLGSLQGETRTAA